MTSFSQQVTTVVIENPLIKTQPILKVHNLGITLHRDGLPIQLLKGVGFTLESGSTLGILGESGCGKSLLAKALVSIFPPESTVMGEILFCPGDKEEIDLITLDISALRGIRGKRIGIMFQDTLSSMNPVLTCGRQIFDALPEARRKDHKVGKNRVVELLDLVGLVNPKRIFETYPHELSGGMIQRVALAAALAGNPDILIVDEPTTALDVISQVELIETLMGLKKEMELSVIVISHDIKMVEGWVDRLMVMYSGNIVEYGKSKDVLISPSHPYTKALLKTAESYEHGRKPISIPGDPPSTLFRPSGCNFHPRCDFMEEKCSQEEPRISETKLGGFVRCFYPIEWK